MSILCVYVVGLEVKKDQSGNIVITEVLEDGAAFNDGFLQVSVLWYNNHTCIIRISCSLLFA